MREKHFVEQNKEKWERFERVYFGASNAQPEEVDELYTKITNDLSYARTFYNRRSIRVYLNKLAQSVYSELYKYRKGRKKAFTKFWTDQLPRALYKSRRELNISLFFFLLAMLIGVLSSIHENDFAQTILGDAYVEMTEENIAKGQPMAVYDSGSNIDMFFRITWNNIQVAFLTYVLGAFFAIGSLLILLYNGIMVGTFQYFFIERELFQESFLTIWMHGAFEISAIVIAGGAGLTLGKGFLFPGTLPRIQSFQITARRSVEIMLGLIPIFIAAGFIEGFFTRFTEVPDWIRGVFIILCFACVAYYFWIYPYLKFRNSEAEFDLDHLSETEEKVVKLNMLRSSREIFSATLNIYRQNFSKLLATAIPTSLVYSLIFYLMNSEDLATKAFFGESYFDITLYLSQFSGYGVFSNMFFPSLIAMSLIIWQTLNIVQKHKQGKKWIQHGIISFIKVIVITGLFELAIWSNNGWFIFLAFISIPALLFWLAISSIEKKSLILSLVRGAGLIRQSRRNIYASFLAFFFICFLLIGMAGMPVSSLYLEGILSLIDAKPETQYEIGLLCVLLVHKLGIYLILPILMINQLLEANSAIEIADAGDLALQVHKIGSKEKAYGLEKE